MQMSWHQKSQSLFLIVGSIFILSLIGWGYYAIVLLLFAFVLLIFALISLIKPLGRALTVLNWLGLIVLLMMTFIRVVLINQEQRLRYECRWSEPPGRGAHQPKTVELVPLSHPNHYDGIYSKDLSEFLLSLGQEHITVEYDVVYDFFQVRGYSVGSIAGRELCPMSTSCPEGTIRTEGGYGGIRSSKSGTKQNNMFAYFQ